MPEMFSWYIDNNNYLTEEFVKKIIAFEQEAKEKNITLAEVNEIHNPTVGNKSAAVTAARDFGLINGEVLSDSSIMYHSGFYRFSDLVIDLLSKRNVSKAEAIPMKPLVILSIVFNKMRLLGIKCEECFITTAECYEYLSVLDCYEDITDDLVLRIVEERVYDENTNVLKKRVNVKNEVLLTEIFNALSNSLVFRLGDAKTVLCAEEKYWEIIEFVAQKGTEISFAPRGGRGGNNTDLYIYYSSIEFGIMEILPQVRFRQDVPTNLTQMLFEYLFGIKKYSGIDWDQYLEKDYYGIYRIFFPIKGIVCAKIYLSNPVTAEQLTDYIAQTDDYKDELKEGILVISVPFEERGHTTIERLKAEDSEESFRVAGGENILFYGVPGAGKSHKIEDVIGNKPYERVVFHPDYTYSDFVGQIMPKLQKDEHDKEKLTYRFVSGPFTNALKKADEKKDEMFYLVIEEINRGNAPAIFGDIFQLLDRNEDGSGKYSITNCDVAKELYGEDGQDKKIVIPSNLTILATMNTSDQNVFTLDTAFQRRWEMKYIPNDIDKAEHANEPIQGSEITWGRFANVINEEIVEYSAELGSAEDKQLGAYFAKTPDLAVFKFPEKTLKYLWDDAFKLNRDAIFEERVKSIGSLIKTYMDEFDKGNDPLKAVLNSDVYKKMISKSAKEDRDNDAQTEEESSSVTEE